MLLPRLPVLSALLVLLLATGRCSVLELTGRTLKTRTETAVGLTRHQVKTPERETRSPQGLEGHPKDPRQKEKFIKHLTGPLYFNPKCKKHFHRLYHSTRDCTIPAYYKRCARLLTRLANSPRCSDR